MTTTYRLILAAFLLWTSPARAQDPLPTGDVPAEDLRGQLRLATEQLARHEAALAELRDLQAALRVQLAAPAPRAEAWYERLHIRGYTQLRYTQNVTNDQLINEQGDKSIGASGGFFIRRARLILYGDIHPRVSIYFQPDLASAISDQLSVAILRDWYADVYLDAKKEFRLRLGQSKVPFGFENLQSSQNRLAFDRNDALNSTVKDERDLGAFFYWAPDRIRKRFKHLVDAGLKGSGDYGVVGLGLYNGQTANRFELNRFPHAILRVSWPFAIGGQILEVGGGGYYGKYTVKLEDQKGVKYTSTAPDNTFDDARGHLSVILYPQPFGFSAEYNVGVGPSLSPDQPTVVDGQFLYGGYVQLMYKVDHPLGTVSIIPYARGTMYDGGKKFQTNAPRYTVREIEMGCEWQIMKPLELTAAYLIADRTSDKHPYEQQSGHVARLQVQINY